jgi:hypothetical protein
MEIMGDKYLKPDGEYYEVQRFNRILIALIIGILLLVSWYSFYLQIIAGIPFGNNPAPDFVVILIAAVFGNIILRIFRSPDTGDKRG